MEYMILPTQLYHKEVFGVIDHGFGVYSLTQEYKVIQIYKRDNIPSTSQTRLSVSEVNTLGTGKWRSLGDVPYRYVGGWGPFQNGHAHWTVGGKDSPEKLYAFDFENETFKLFPSPPVETIEGSHVHFKSLAVLKGCLCQSDTFDSQFTIWVMKEYVIKKSWHREVMIKQSISCDLYLLMWEDVCLIERLRDGTILMEYDEEKLLAYSTQTGTITDSKFFDRAFTGIAYSPRFLKLQNFESERVHVF